MKGFWFSNGKIVQLCWVIEENHDILPNRNSCFSNKIGVVDVLNIFWVEKGNVLSQNLPITVSKKFQGNISV